MEKIEFKASRKKTFFIFILGMAFLILSSLLIATPYTFRFFLMNDIFIIRTIGVVGFLFFCTVLFTLCKKFIFDKKTGIIIDEEGILDNSSYVAVGLIKWSDIKSIRKSNVSSTEFLLIDINNPDEYINRKKGLKKILLKMNYKSYGTPISISSNFVECDFHKLETVIKELLSKYHMA